MHLRGFHVSFPKYKYAHITFEIFLRAPLPPNDLFYFKPPCPCIDFTLCPLPLVFPAVLPPDNYCTVAD